MHTNLHSRSSGKVQFSGIVPPSLVDLLIKGASASVASGPFGDFLFQEIRSSESAVWYNNYLLVKDDIFTSTDKQPRLELQFGLNNSFSNTAHFAKAFRKYYGYTPAQLRKEKTNGIANGKQELLIRKNTPCRVGPSALLAPGPGDF